MRALRPRSLVSALTGRPQSPRLAIVCFGCDEFYKPGSGEAVPTAARDIRNRLGEAAKQFGMQLPTYVVFTKLDSIPYFDAYTRNLSADEAREPLGAGVYPDAGGAGTYADRVTPRLQQSFSELFSSLADRRVQALTREFGDEWKPGAYEFPREFNKLGPLAVDFLREIGRPSELSVSPILRGFYFTGVQAVFVNETAPEYQAPAAAGAAGRGRALGDGRVQRRSGAAAAAHSAQAGRGNAQGSALGFPAARAARSRVRRRRGGATHVRRRARQLLATRRTRCRHRRSRCLYAIALMVSYRGNRAIQASALDATRGIASLAPNPVDLPPADALQRLDALRIQLDSLSAYEHDGAPIGLRWGLYSGTRLYPEVRNAYFGGFDKLMFAGTRANMLATLRALPDAPTANDDYSDTYSLLKAYIVTTSHPEKSTADFLAPALMTRWLAGRPIDSARAQLARRQFATYANELRYANPFADTADVAAVAKARKFLRQFAGSESIYQFMLAEANKANPPIQFNKKLASAAPYVVDAYEVPGAFTKGGSVFMLAAFKTVDKYITGENWVVGDDASGGDKAKLVADLSARYAADYIGHWRKFLVGGAGDALLEREGRGAEAGDSERQSVAAARALLDRVAEHGRRASRRRDDVPTGAARHAAVGDGQVDRRKERAVHHGAAHVPVVARPDGERRGSGGRVGGGTGRGQRDRRAHRGTTDRRGLHDRSAGARAFDRAEPHGSADRLRRAAAEELWRGGDQRARARVLRRGSAAARQVPVQSGCERAGVARRSDRHASARYGNAMEVL